MGSQKTIRGKGAVVAGGVLSFTVIDPGNPNDGAKATYKVARTGATNGSSGDAATWLAQDTNNNVILFFVQSGTVAGQVYSGIAGQAIRKAMLPAAGPQ